MEVEGTKTNLLFGTTFIPTKKHAIYQKIVVPTIEC